MGMARPHACNDSTATLCNCSSGQGIMYSISPNIHRDGDGIWQPCMPMLGMRWENMNTFRSSLCILLLISSDVHNVYR